MRNNQSGFNTKRLTAVRGCKCKMANESEPSVLSCGGQNHCEVHVWSTN